jgi:hypothetical protein
MKLQLAAKKDVHPILHEVAISFKLKLFVQPLL